MDQIPPTKQTKLTSEVSFPKQQNKKCADIVPVTFVDRSYMCFNALCFAAWSAVFARKIFHLNSLLSPGANTSGFSIFTTSRQALCASEGSTTTHRVCVRMFHRNMNSLLEHQQYCTQQRGSEKDKDLPGLYYWNHLILRNLRNMWTL